MEAGSSPRRARPRAAAAPTRAGLNHGQIALLRGVVLDQTHSLPTDPDALNLLHDGRLLAYGGDSEWYFPHTLLLLQRVRIRVSPPVG